MQHERSLVAIVAALLVLSVLPAGAVPALASSSGQSAAGYSGESAAGQTPTNDTSVNVTTGRQLSTVLAVTSDDVRTEIEASAFEAEFDAGDESERAEAIADRANELRERAASIREGYEAATEAYREGDLTREEYARRLATLNARASNLVDDADRLEQRAANVSTLELRAAGLNRSALETAVEDVDAIHGTGAAALLRRFTGQSEGEVELETEGGLAIEVANEDGERSRELERPGDDSTEITRSQAAALETARDGLTPTDGEWLLTGAKIDGDDGEYSFEFRLDGDNRTGDAELTVDGSAGRIVELEEEIEPDDGDDAERDEDEDDEADDDDPDEDGDDDGDVEDDEEREIALVVTDGTVGPDETVTVRALAGGEPAANVTVSLNGDPVATTDADGTATVTLPASGDVELAAGEGELEFEFDDAEDRDDDELRRNLAVNATLEDGVVTTSIVYDGSGVSNATVFANGDSVGTTDDAGTVAFDVDESVEELELEFAKGEFEAEVEFRVDNGTLVRSDQEELDDREEDGSEGPDDEEDDEADDETEDEEEDGMDDDVEETEEEDEDDDDGGDDDEETETPE